MLFVRGGLGIRRQRERAALRVTADGPALTGVDHRTTKVLDALKRGGNVGHREIGQRSIVTGSRSTLVHSEAKISTARLPAHPGFAGPWRELGAQHPAPESPGTLRVVGRELDQWGRHACEYRAFGGTFTRKRTKGGPDQRDVADLAGRGVGPGVCGRLLPRSLLGLLLKPALAERGASARPESAPFHARRWSTPSGSRPRPAARPRGPRV